MCGRAFAQSNDLASHKRRTVCSPPEPPSDSINALYTMETNVIQQAGLDETQANTSFQHSAKFVATSNNQISYINGRLVNISNTYFITSALCLKHIFQIDNRIITSSRILRSSNIILSQ